MKESESRWEPQRKALEAMLQNIRESGSRSLQHLKERFDANNEEPAALFVQLENSAVSLAGLPSVREVRAALDRIKDGSYGDCFRCEEPIMLKRLKAVPWAEHCISCQKEMEDRIGEPAESCQAAAAGAY